MNKTLHLLLPLVLLARAASAQGTFIYDQQSSDEATVYEGGALMADHPVQSFTPALDSVGFIRLYLWGINALNMRINLRADSPTGPILGTTESATFPSLTSGPFTFQFSEPVPLTPGAAYFFEPVAQTGGGWLNATPTYHYEGGSLNGGAYDLWFREGIVVPEPATGSLALLAAAVALRSRSRRPKPHPNTP